MRALGLLALLAALSGAGCADGDDEAAPYTIACAASLRRVLPDLLAAYAATGAPDDFQATYAGSGTLVQQVKGGAPIAGVLLAGASDVDRLIAEGRVDAATRVVVARNVLVLVAAPGAAPTTFRSLPDLPPGARIAIGDPRSVPAGRYAREALGNLGIWDALKERVVPAADVSGVTAWVRRGEVAAGIVYATEVIGVSGLEVLDRAQGDWAPAASVVGGACRGAAGAEAMGALLRYLASEPARSVWRRHGFLPP